MQRPLTDEERAAKEAHLTELRRQMNSQGDAPWPSNAANNNNNLPTDANDDYAQDSDDDDEAEEFFREAERAHEWAAGVCMYAKPMGELLGETVETGLDTVRRTVGDFELLRLAKMGDHVSFKEFESLVGIDPTTFKDNHGRNALHYAADSGDVSMLQYLIDKKVPFTTDEKKMTPVDIAALNQHNEAAKILAESFSEAAEALKNYEEAVEVFRQPPPRMTISKPAPAAQKESRHRAFWKNTGTATATTTNTNAKETKAQFTISQLADSHHEQIVNTLCGMSLTHESQGFHNWLPPAERTTLTAALPHATVIGAMQTVDGNEKEKEVLHGLVLALPLGGSIVGNKGAVMAKNPVLVTQLAVHPTARGGNVAALLLAELQNSLQASGNDVVVFRSALQLPVPAVGLLKWSQRSIAPCSVMRQRHAQEIFPDFFSYDEILRADIVTKHALTKTFHAERAKTSQGWCSVDSDNEEQMKLLHKFLVENAVKVFEFAYLPETSDELLQAVIADGLFPFVYVSPTTHEVSDFVVLRLRNLYGNTSSDDDERKSAAMCVYAIFTSFKGPGKAEEILMLSEKLKCETVFIPHMFGFLDSDLSKAMFEEVLSYREYLYVLKSPMESVLPPTPLSKVAIPCAFI